MREGARAENVSEAALERRLAEAHALRQGCDGWRFVELLGEEGSGLANLSERILKGKMCRRFIGFNGLCQLGEEVRKQIKPARRDREISA